MERQSVVDVPQGLALLRYVEARDRDAPLVTFAPTPESSASLSIVSAPGSSAASFDRPGQCVVLVSSTSAAKLMISVRARSGGSVDARLEIESLDRGRAAMGAATPNPASLTSALSVVGHVARRGDVVVRAGEWIAGPQAPAPIEGLTLRTADDAAQAVEVQVSVAGSTSWSSWQSAHLYAGTRGQARPLTGLRLRLTPSARANLEIEGSALFLGSPVIQRSGHEIELRSGSGSDPLVGLRLKIVASTKLEPRASRDAQATRGRVRVFRPSDTRLSA